MELERHSPIIPQSRHTQRWLAHHSPPVEIHRGKTANQFLCEIPEIDRLLFKHRVTDLNVIHGWCHRERFCRCWRWPTIRSSPRLQLLIR